MEHESTGFLSFRTLSIPLKEETTINCKLLLFLHKSSSHC